MSMMLRALWKYRGFIFGSVKREFQLKYLKSILGAAWTVLNPLSMIIVYTVIFSKLMRARLPGVDSTFSYGIYLCSGVLTWGFFAEITGRSKNVFLEHANLLKKLSFPRLCLPVTIVASAGLNFCIIFGLFTLFLIISGNFPGWTYIGILPVLALQTLFAIGLGMVLGVLNVFFRDVGQLFDVIMQFWFWLTPIVYMQDILPEVIRRWMHFNPMAGLIYSYQIIFVHSRWPNFISLWPTMVLTIALCGWGLWLFRRKAGEMVDEL